MEFRIDQIDHVEVDVPDRYEAAQWYANVLGFSIDPEFEFWADSPEGPLMLVSQQGGTKLALFTGQPAGSQRSIGFHLVAFRVNAKNFIRFLDRLPELHLVNRAGQPVHRESVADHTRAFSLYFCDPYQNQLELTTYDYEATQKALASQ